jgi:lambda family phage tail tape measure protein
MALATLSIDLEARLAKLDGDLGRAVRLNEKAAADIQARWDGLASGIGMAAGAVGSAVISGALLQQLRGIVDGIDALNDVSDATGSSVEKISALEDVALRTGASLETVESAMLKLNQALKGAKEGDDTDRALKQIGLSAKELRDIDPADAVKVVSDALANFADDGNKARLVQELFGKSAKELAPFLKDLADRTSLLGTVTKEQAKEAERFNLQLSELHANSVQAGRSMVSDLLPALNKIIEGMRTASSVFGGFFKGLAALNPLEGVYDNAIDGLKAYRAELDTIEPKLADLRKQQEDGSLREKAYGLTMLYQLESRKEKVQKLVQYYSQLLKLSDGSAGGGRGNVNPTDEAKSVGELTTKPDKVAKAHKDALSDYDKLIKKIAEYKAAQDMEIDGNAALTQGQRTALEAMVLIRDGLLDMTVAQKQAVTARLEDMLATEKLNEARKEEEKWLAESAREMNAKVEEQTRYLQSIRDQAQAQRDENEQIGLNTDQLADYRRAKQLATAADLEGKAALWEDMESHKQMVALWRDQAKAIREVVAEQVKGLAKLKAYNADAAGGMSDGLESYRKKLQDVRSSTAQAAESALQNTEDALTTFFTTGKLGAKDLITSIIAEFTRLQVVKPMMAALTSGSSWSSLLSLFGGSSSGGTAAGTTVGVDAVGLGGMAAHGAWFDGQTAAFAKGGTFANQVVSAPTAFKFAQGGAIKNGLMGEAGPEAIMPLVRMGSGHLGVRSAGGDAAQPIVVNQSFSVGELVTPSQARDIAAQSARESTLAIERAKARSGRGA